MSGVGRKVLSPAESGRLIVDTARDVAIIKEGVQKAARHIYDAFQSGKLSLQNFKQSEMHPKVADEKAIDWIFLVDTLNVSFWSGPSESGGEDVPKWEVKYNGKVYTGYFAFCAGVNRAITEGFKEKDGDVISMVMWTNQEGLDITNPKVFGSLTLDDIYRIFRSETSTPIPLAEERVKSLKEVSEVLLSKYSGSFVNCVKASQGSALALLKTVVEDFPCYRDEATYVYDENTIVNLRFLLKDGPRNVAHNCQNCAQHQKISPKIQSKFDARRPEGGKRWCASGRPRSPFGPRQSDRGGGHEDLQAGVRSGLRATDECVEKYPPLLPTAENFKKVLHEALAEAGEEDLLHIRKYMETPHSSQDPLEQEGNEPVRPTAPDPYCYADINGQSVPFFLPLETVQAIQLEQSTRGVVRLLLNHLHPTIRVLRKFTYKPKTTADPQSSADDEEVRELPGPQQIPTRTVMMVHAAIRQRFPLGDIPDPIMYSKLYNDRERGTRESIRRVLQYYRDEYDEEGRQIKRKRAPPKSKGAIKSYSSPSKKSKYKQQK